jgi:excinuclease UvrABC nuclease subunit
MNCLLFLGAGASKAVGIGDLQDLTAKVTDKLINKGYGDILEHTIETLKTANQESIFFNQGEVDLEVIFSILNSRTDHIKTIKELGPYPIYLSELGQIVNLPYSDKFPKKKEIEDIKKIVGDVITSSCIDYDEGKAQKYYDELFQIEKEISGYKTASGTTSSPRLF